MDGSGHWVAAFQLARLPAAGAHDRLREVTNNGLQRPVDLILQFIVGYLLDRLTPATVLILCCSLLVVTLALVAEVRDTPLLVLIMLALMGGGSAALYTAGLAGINDAFSAAEMPSGTAVFTMLWYVGGLTGPMVAGAAMEAWNPFGMAATAAAACAIVALINGVAAVRARTA